MFLKVVILTISISTTLAFPLQSDFRGGSWTDTKTNQAHDKSDLTKDMDKIYKSIIDSSALYSQESEGNKNPMAEEMQQKLSMESERLRTRLRQELAELRERLSPSSAHLSTTLASIRERLTPITQQLQSSLRSNTQEMCSQLSLYLQGMEAVEAQGEHSPALYQEAFQWLSQTVEQNSAHLANMLSEFHTAALGVLEHLKQANGPEEEPTSSSLWQQVSSRFGQELSTLREEVQSRMSALQTQFATLQEPAKSQTSDVKSSMNSSCQNAAEQSLNLQAWLEKLLTAIEEDLHAASSTSYSLPVHQDGSLREDFSVKLSALIEDILHSVQ